MGRRKTLLTYSRKHLTNEVKNFAIKGGADLVGIASVENYLKVQNPPEGHTPEDILPGSKNIVIMIVAGIDFPRLDKLITLEHPMLEKPIINYPLGTPEYSSNNSILQCGRGGYAHIDILADKLTRFIIKKGFNAVPIPGGHPYFQEPLHGVLSHKHVAEQAGLGQIGLSSLLLTREFGPNCYLVSVLTDAPLAPDKPFKANLCQEAQEKCGLACIKKCPQNALGYNWKGSFPVPSEYGSIDKEACKQRIRILSRAMGYHMDNYHGRHHGFTLQCGTCVRACPIGRRL